MITLRKWFADESPENTDVSSESEEIDNEEWEEKVARR